MDFKKKTLNEYDHHSLSIFVIVFLIKIIPFLRDFEISEDRWIILFVILFPMRGIQLICIIDWN